jgi:hypothetical protein
MTKINEFSVCHVAFVTVAIPANPLKISNFVCAPSASWGFVVNACVSTKNKVASSVSAFVGLLFQKSLNLAPQFRISKPSSCSGFENTHVAIQARNVFGSSALDTFAGIGELRPSSLAVSPHLLSALFASLVFAVSFPSASSAMLAQWSVVPFFSLLGLAGITVLRCSRPSDATINTATILIGFSPDSFVALNRFCCAFMASARSFRIWFFTNNTLALSHQFGRMFRAFISVVSTAIKNRARTMADDINHFQLVAHNKKTPAAFEVKCAGDGANKSNGR